MNQALQKEPGCYGFSVTYTADSPMCQECEWHDGCKESAEQMMERVAEELSPDDLVNIFRKSKKRSPEELNVNLETEQARRNMLRVVSGKRDLTSAEQELIASFKLKNMAKAINLAKFIFTNNIDLHGALKRGVNPFDGFTKNQQLRIAWDMMQEGATREEMTNVYQEFKGCSEGTARPVILNTVKLLVELGVASEVDGIYTLNKG